MDYSGIADSLSRFGPSPERTPSFGETYAGVFGMFFPHALSIFYLIAHLST
jgi:hypothetical protein